VLLCTAKNCVFFCNNSIINTRLCETVFLMSRIYNNEYTIYIDSLQEHAFERWGDCGEDDVLFQKGGGLTYETELGGIGGGYGISV
jgi:hypothetical protein